MGPRLLQGAPVTPGDVDADDRPRHRVETRGKDDGIELQRLVDEVDTGLGDRCDRLGAEIDEPDVGQVVRLEVTGVDAEPLRPDRIVLRAKRFGRLGITHDRTDLAPHKLGEQFVGLFVGEVVRIAGEELDESAPLPSRLVVSQSLLIRNREGTHLANLDGHPERRQPGGFPVLVAPPVERLALGLRDRSVVRRDREVGRPLKHRQLGGLFGDDRDRLDSRRSGADHRNALAGEVDPIVGPTAREVHLAFEAIGAGDVDHFGYRQASRCHHVEASGDLLPAGGTQVPTRRPFIPRRRLDAREELNVASQIVFVRDVLQIPENFGLGRVLL